MSEVLLYKQWHVEKGQGWDLGGRGRRSVGRGVRKVDIRLPGKGNSTPVAQGRSTHVDD